MGKRTPFRMGEWVARRMHAYPLGFVAHPVGDFEVDRAFYDRMQSTHSVMRAYGYAPPIMREHEPDGGLSGVIWELEWDDASGIWLHTRVRPDVDAAIERGEHLYVSPSHYEEFIDPHTGDVLEVFLSEISLVSAPYLKGLQPLTDYYESKEGAHEGAKPYALGALEGTRWSMHETGLVVATTARPLPHGVDMTNTKTKIKAKTNGEGEGGQAEEVEATPNSEGEETTTSMEGLEGLEAVIGPMLDARFAAFATEIGGMFAEYLGGDGEGVENDGEGEDDDVEMSEVERLATENAELHIQLALGDDVDDDTRTNLMEVARSAPALFTATLSTLSKARGTTTKTPRTPKKPGATRRRAASEQGPGANPTPSTTTTSDPVAVAKAFREGGGKRGARAISHVIRKTGVSHDEASEACAQAYAD